MVKKDDLGKLFLGSILILAGTFMVLANFFKLSIFGILFLPLLGLLFIIWSIVSKESELLVPGGIIEGLGLGLVVTSLLSGFNEPTRGGLFFIGFSIGWFLITLLCKLIFKKIILWPFIPGFLLLLLGFLIMIGDKGFKLFQNLNIIWPFILIVAGLIIILTFFKVKSRR